MLALIVVDFCSLHRTLKYIEHFISQSVHPDLIHPIIIDNSPKNQIKEIDDELFFLKEEGEFEGREICSISTNNYKILYCFAGDNLGYAKGNNLGTRIADYFYNDPYYIISNNDLMIGTRFDEEAFIDIFNNDASIAVIGPNVVGLDSKPQSPHKKISSFKRLIAYYWFCRWPFRWKPDYDYDGKSKICYRVMGSFMIVKADLFRKAGCFDNNTFMFCEEPILSERLKRIGAKTFFYNSWTVVHAHGETVKNAASQLRAEQWAFDSCCYYYRQYIGTHKLIISIAKLNFRLYGLSLKIREVIKKIIKKVIKK